jgi:LuxR family transcriptional regulator, maltose regulon positive regulatory protein
MTDLAHPVRVRPCPCRAAGLIDRATRQRVTVVCAPEGTGKTAACSAWMAASAGTRYAVWLTVGPEDDPGLFWASVCSGLQRAGAVPPELTRVLEDGPARTFPLRLVEMARLSGEPTVIVLDDIDNLTDDHVLTGLNLLARHAPQNLHLVMCGRRPPQLQLSKLRASGDLSEIGPAALRAVFADPSCTWHAGRDEKRVWRKPVASSHEVKR